MSICTENAHALVALRQLVAENHYTLTNEFNCGLVTPLQRENQRYMEAMQEVLHEFVCDTEELSYISIRMEHFQESGTGVWAEMIFYDEDGVALNDRVASNGQGNYFGTEFRSFDTTFQDLNAQTLPDGSVKPPGWVTRWSIINDGDLNPYYRGVRIVGDTVYLLATPGFKGYVEFNIRTDLGGGANSDDQYVKAYINEGINDTLAWNGGVQIGQYSMTCSEVGLDVVAQWLTEAALSGCDEVQNLHYINDCSDTKYLSCDLIVSSGFTYDWSVSQNGDGDWAITQIALTPNSGISDVVVYERYSIVTVTNPSEDPVEYRLEQVGSNNYYSVIGVRDAGEELWTDTQEIVLDANDTLVFQTDLVVETTYGNQCVRQFSDKILGTDYIPYTEPMLISASDGIVDVQDYVNGGTTQGIVWEFSHSAIASPGTEVKLYLDGVEIYTYVIGTDPLVHFDGIEVTFSLPSQYVKPTPPGTYSMSWPSGWIKNNFNQPIAALTVGTYEWDVSSTPTTGFPYTFPFNLS